MKTTPGPWTFDPDAETVTSADLTMILYDVNTNDGDGHLIAASPDLYEALKIAQENLQFMPMREVEEQIAAALAKAEGR